MRLPFFSTLFCATVSWTVFAGNAHAQSEAPSSPPTDHASAAPDQAKKEEAYGRFKAGLEHFDRQEWSAALVEFLRSRELYPTRAATKNAAWCMRKEGRFDEALGLYEALLRETPDLSPQDREFVDRE